MNGRSICFVIFLFASIFLDETHSLQNAGRELNAPKPTTSGNITEISSSTAGPEETVISSTTSPTPLPYNHHSTETSPDGQITTGNPNPPISITTDRSSADPATEHTIQSFTDASTEDISSTTAIPMTTNDHLVTTSLQQSSQSASTDSFSASTTPDSTSTLTTPEHQSTPEYVNNASFTPTTATGNSTAESLTKPGDNHLKRPVRVAQNGMTILNWIAAIGALIWMIIILVGFFRGDMFYDDLFRRFHKDPLTLSERDVVVAKPINRDAPYLRLRKQQLLQHQQATTKIHPPESSAESTQASTNLESFNSKQK